MIRGRRGDSCCHDSRRAVTLNIAVNQSASLHVLLLLHFLLKHLQLGHFHFNSLLWFCILVRPTQSNLIVRQHLHRFCHRHWRLPPPHYCHCCYSPGYLPQTD
uniref:(northern house mosquito) hypothetical protein n=1 Tax=Culex pipiens TaxID=7175 RepID=A0A8D7ZYE5_CULPI